MCLLLAAHRVHPLFDLAVAANRDELHARPTAPMHHWREPAGMLAGQDLSAGGTWLGVDPAGRFASVTNFHEHAASRPDQPSRGRLVVDYLGGAQDAAAYLEQLERTAADYAGFNLLLADRDSLWYASNRSPGFARRLPPGVYSLSNHLLDTPWPKAVSARTQLARWVDTGSRALEPLRELLLDSESQTGSDLPWPASSGPFVKGAEFGTRSSTWLARDQRLLQIGEENFTPQGRSSGRAQFSVSLPASTAGPHL
jgi:uncharacterized protein with NRDE domain